MEMYTFHPYGGAKFFVSETDCSIIINIISGDLELKYQNTLLVSFPLITDEEPKEQAILWDGNHQLQIGDVDFLNNPTDLWEYPVNTGELEVNISLQSQGGFLGSLDIKDVFQQIKDTFDITQVPIVFSRVGNYLRVVTLRCSEQAGSNCWYKRTNITVEI